MVKNYNDSLFIFFIISTRHCKAIAGLLGGYYYLLLLGVFTLYQWYFMFLKLNSVKHSLCSLQKILLFAKQKQKAKQAKSIQKPHLFR